jgi:hypothetical protein
VKNMDFILFQKYPTKVSKNLHDALFLPMVRRRKKIIVLGMFSSRDNPVKITDFILF